MADPIQIKEKFIREKLKEALASLEELSKSDYWSYTREFDAGQLDAARMLVRNVLVSNFPEAEKEIGELL